MAPRESPWWLPGAAALAVGSAKLLLRRSRTTAAVRVLAGRRRWRTTVDLQAAAGAVERAARFLRADCLPQSVALTALLQRTGRAPALVIGCRRYEAKKWGAHAWVEVEGQRLDPLAHEQHEELCRLSAEGRWEIAPADRQGIRE